MDYGNMLGDSFNYATEAVFGKWLKWILLIIPFMSHGYSLAVFKGGKPAPEVNDWIANFINGIKLFIVQLIYCIPLIIIGIIAMVLGVGAAFAGDAGIMAAGLVFLIAGLVALVYCIALIFILPMAAIRFARTDSFGEAFNVGAILASISAIGWISYLIAIIVLCVVAVIFGIIIGIIAFVFALIPFLGILLILLLDLFLVILSPPIVIFCARYFTQIYDSAA